MNDVLALGATLALPIPVRAAGANRGALRDALGLVLAGEVAERNDGPTGAPIILLLSPSARTPR
jgi:hypothetical protein